jgi:hypothetical protein
MAMIYWYSKGNATVQLPREEKKSNSQQPEQPPIATPGVPDFIKDSPRAAAPPKEQCRSAAVALSKPKSDLECSPERKSVQSTDIAFNKKKNG